MYRKEEIILWVINELEGGSKIITDSGGLTKYGISKRGNPDIDVANLTEAQAIKIYDVRYWMKAGCDNFPYPYNLIIFDTAVNCGHMLADILFYATLQNCTPLYLLMQRLKYYSKLMQGKSKYDIYAEGWLNRILKIFDKLNGEGLVNGTA